MQDFNQCSTFVVMPFCGARTFVPFQESFGCKLRTYFILHTQTFNFTNQLYGKTLYIYFMSQIEFDIRVYILNIACNLCPYAPLYSYHQHNCSQIVIKVYTVFTDMYKQFMVLHSSDTPYFKLSSHILCLGSSSLHFCLTFD